MKEYYVYIMTNNSGTLYTGVTNNLERRVVEHKQQVTPGFTSRYKIARLVYFETTTGVLAAIEREKQIKGFVRQKKFALIRSMNPLWKDLSGEWFAEPDSLIRDQRNRPESARPDSSLVAQNDKTNE